MAQWMLAPALVQLRAEVNAAWPDRSKASDGTIGDPAHAARTSDHNPNSEGVVRALDITARGIDADAYAEHIRTLGVSGHPALKNHGYVIWNGRAAYASSGWKWQRYTGSNPHKTHCHVSVGRDRAQYNSKQSWLIDLINGDEGELSVSDVEAIMKKLERQDKLIGDIHLAVYGADLPAAGDDNPRHNSIYTGVKYLRGEIIGGKLEDPNSALSIWRRIQDRFRVPDKTA